MRNGAAHILIKLIMSKWESQFASNDEKHQASHNNYFTKQNHQSNEAIPLFKPQINLSVAISSLFLFIRILVNFVFYPIQACI